MRNLVSLAAVTTLFAILLSALPCLALENQYTENFTTTTYKDVPSTTAWWDTVAGELKLPPYDLTLLGSYDTPDEARGLAISGDYAYVADWQSGLLVIDISDLANPTLAGSYDTPGDAGGVAISGNYAYVGDWVWGLQVIDISDPTNPTLAGSYNTPGNAWGVAISGDYAYVGDKASGLQVIDISDPTNPTLAGSHSTPGWAYGVAISGDYAYVADYGSGLQVFDISDPTNPTLAGSYNTPGQAWDVAISGDHAYVADSDVGGLQVLDVSDPTNPVLVGSHDTPGAAFGVTISGDHAYVADHADGGLQVIDISDPTYPTFLGSYDTPGIAWDVVISGDHAYVADYTSGLQVIRIADPVLPPEFAGDGDTPVPVFRVAIAGDYAFTHAGGGLGIAAFDISTPENPTVAGSYAGTFGDVVVDGNHAYAANAGSGFLVLDVSDPTNLTYAGSLSVGWPKSVAVQGNYAYLGVDYTSNGFKVIDISDPTNPTLAGSLSYGIGFGPVAVDGNWAYAAAGVTFMSVDISDPSAPVLGGTYITPGNGLYGITVAGDYAYLVDGTYGIHVIDISDPTTPVLAGSYDTSSTAFNVAISGDYAYVADYSSGLLVLDISDPTNPVLAASPAVAGNAMRVAVAGDYAFVAAEDGLHVLQVFQRTMDLTGDVGQSIDVGLFTENIVEAKLATSQNDAITWEMSADGGSNWQAVLPDGNWNQLAISGSDFRWRSTHTPVNLRTNPTCTSLQFDFLFEFPVVDVVEDIPNDQGRQVSISWTRSVNDQAGSGNPITEYAIYRKVDPDLTASQALVEEGNQSADLSFQADGNPVIESLPPGSWHFIMTVPALTEETYATVVPTLADSTISDGMYLSTFIVLALTATPGVYFESPPESGYSVDNIAPGVPQDILAGYQATGVALDWEDAPDLDFLFYRIYRGTDPGFTPSPDNLIHEIAVSAWADLAANPWGYHYKITTLDYSGNESEAASPLEVTGVQDGTVPTRTALLSAVPNPFNPSTKLSFEMAAAGQARLNVYDTAGRLVVTLVNERRDAGLNEVTWDGRDQAGRIASAGVYLYRLEVESYVETKRMTLIK